MAPTKAEIFDAVEAQGQTVENLSERILVIENRSEKQDERNRNIIIGVLVAAILVLVTVAAEVIISDRSDRERTDHLLERALSAENKSNNLEKDFNSLKLKNPYLK